MRFFERLAADPAFDLPADEEADGASLSGDECRAVREAHRAIQEDVYFEADYGAALVFRCTPDDQSALQVDVIGLDGWEFTTTSSLPLANASAHPSCQPCVLYVGSFEKGRRERFVQAFEAILSKVK
jgi:hypothetical protein